MKYCIWENKETKNIVLRPESTELSTEFWTVVHTFEVDSRAEAVEQFKEMGGEP